MTAIPPRGSPFPRGTLMISYPGGESDLHGSHITFIVNKPGFTKCKYINVVFNYRVSNDPLPGFCLGRLAVQGHD